jgi:hypothetical protein
MFLSATDRVWLGGPCWVALAIAVGTGPATVAADPQPDTVTLSVVIDTPSIYADDPVLLKCVLRNDGKQGVSVFGAFDPLRSTLTSGARIEVRAPDTKDFKSALTIGAGRAFIVPKHWELRAGETIACYPRLGCVPTPGKWQVRVRITVDDKEIVSQPVTVSVARRPAESRKLLEEYDSAVGKCFALHGHIDVEDLQKALMALAGSEAGRAITEAQLLRALRTASAARARALALDDIKKHRDGLGPVTREYFDLSTAQILIGHKDYDRAKALLDAIPDPSNMRGSMQLEIRRAEEKK